MTRLSQSPSIKNKEISGVPNPRHRTGIHLMPMCEGVSIHSNIFIDICISKLFNWKAAMSSTTQLCKMVSPRNQAIMDFFNLLLAKYVGVLE